MLRKATRTPREGTSARAAGAIAVTLVLAAAAPGAQAQSDFVAIDFRTATTQWQRAGGPDGRHLHHAAVVCPTRDG